jgi:hypothetical protein
MTKSFDFQTNEFLFRFYRKRTTSFLANIYKAGITGTAKDIHRSRLDVKKIIAIFHLLRIVRGKNEKDPGYERIFTKLYQASGRVREIQVNQLLLTSSQLAPYDHDLYNIYLVKREKERTREFLLAIRNFKEKRLAKCEHEIEKEIFKITTKSLQKKINRYIQAKSDLFMNLLDKDCDEKSLHEIRRHLKEFSTMLTLVIRIKFSRKYEKAVIGLNKTETMIGEWHDRLVLAKSLKEFLDHSDSLSDCKFDPVREFYGFVVETNIKQMQSIIQDARTFIAECLTVIDQEA